MEIGELKLENGTRPDEERFLSAQADRLAGASRKKKRRLAPFGMTVDGGGRKGRARCIVPLRSKGSEPGGQAVGEQPSAPGEAGQAIDPNDAVPCQEKHDEHDEDAMD